MHLKLLDDSIEADRIFGPMPYFSDSFEKFFINKAFKLILNENLDKDHDSDFKYMSLQNETDLDWMYEIELSKSSREQNMEIIYNDNKVYFKTVKTVYKDEILNAFPSKDLEISLGLQFIPFQKENKYECKKCTKPFEYQYKLMLHARYFCSFNTNNFLKNLSQLDSNNKSSNKRKLNDFGFNSQERKKLREKKSPENELADPRSSVSPLDDFSLNENKKSLDPNFNWSDIYTSFQSAMQNYSKNFQASYDQYLNSAVISNQAVKDYFVNQIYSYLENQNKNLNDKKFQLLSPNSSSSSASPQISPSLSLNYLNTSAFPSSKKNPIISQPTPINQFKIPNVVKPSAVELKHSLNTQSLQNWCAKCNTHFRLTSDLVYHMRTFHKKEEGVKNSNCDGIYLTSKYSEFSTDKIGHNLNVNREMKYLKCEICNETFKEKHHLSRHLTSHR